MPLVLQPAVEADAERVAEIEREAYGPSEFSSVLFPGPFPEPVPGAKNSRAEELAKAYRKDPSIRWLKVVDTEIAPTEDNKQMIGFAQWNVNDGSQLPPAPRVFHAGCNKEACAAVFKSLDEVRQKRSNIKHVRKLVPLILTEGDIHPHPFKAPSPTRLVAIPTVNPD